MDRARLRHDWVAIWILWSAWCSICGLVLSSAGQLDRPGYIVSILLFVTGIILVRRRLTAPGPRPLFLVRRSTYRRLAPRLWLALAVVSLIGGLGYHADEYDYLTYRFPRLLHWWWAHHWFWIETTTFRMNFSTTGFEWLMAPIFVLFRTDRPFFLLNWVSFLMLPGLVFSVLRSLGVAGRTAWWSMWVLPAGLCYALQAGGVGNDMFSCVYLLAAFHYGWRARNGLGRALLLSLLSIALVSNCKMSNLPLALPWLTFLFFNWRKPPQAPREWSLLLCTLLVAAFVSCLPTMALNLHFTGDYTGDPTNWEKIKPSDPVSGLVGNLIMIAAANLSPPILPHDITWNVLPGSWQHHLARAFPRFGARSPALVLEESCSLGIGVSFFVILGFLYGIRTAWGRTRIPFPVAGMKWIASGLAVAWLVFMSKLGSDGAARLVAPYYMLTIVLVLALWPFDGVLTRRPVWRATAYLSLLTALLLVAITPGRPLLPPSWITTVLRTLHVPAGVVASWNSNRLLRASHFDAMAPLREAIPPSERVVGLISGDDIPGVSPWLPFGAREVVELDPVRSLPAEAQRRGIRYLMVSSKYLLQQRQITLAELVREWSATIIRSQQVPIKTNDAEEWYLLRLP